MSQAPKGNDTMKSKYNRIDDGELAARDTLFNTLSSLLEHCSEYRINCNYCPNRERCDRIFSGISEKLNHKLMTFEELVKVVERLIPIMRKKQRDLPVLRAISFLIRELGKEGRILSTELQRRADLEGISPDALYRARKRVGVAIEYEMSFGEGRKTYWLSPIFAKKLVKLQLWEENAR